jgi:hypothetical protein
MKYKLFASHTAACPLNLESLSMFFNMREDYNTVCSDLNFVGRQPCVMYIFLKPYYMCCYCVSS